MRNSILPRTFISRRHVFGFITFRYMVHIPHMEPIKFLMTWMALIGWTGTIFNSISNETPNPFLLGRTHLPSPCRNRRARNCRILYNSSDLENWSCSVWMSAIGLADFGLPEWEYWVKNAWLLDVKNYHFFICFKKRKKNEKLSLHSSFLPKLRAHVGGGNSWMPDASYFWLIFL